MKSIPFNNIKQAKTVNLMYALFYFLALSVLHRNIFSTIIKLMLIGLRRFCHRFLCSFVSTLVLCFKLKKNQYYDGWCCCYSLFSYDLGTIESPLKSFCFHKNDKIAVVSSKILICIAILFNKNFVGPMAKWPSCVYFAFHLLWRIDNFMTQEIFYTDAGS